MIVVFGFHRLMHRRTSSPLQTRANSPKPRRDSLPYLQPKAELEDEQRRRHELHGEHLVHELDGKDEIFQMPDETENLILPLQGRRGIHEMPERNHMSCEMPLQGRHEVLGDVNAQELSCPTQESEESTRVDTARELESPVQARVKSITMKSAHGLAAPIGNPTKDSAHVNADRSHFMLRQQLMLDIGVFTSSDQHDVSET